MARTLNVGKLFELAILADINPARCGPSTIRLFAQLFESARFIGRIDREVEARLDPRHVGLLAGLLRGNGPYHDDATCSAPPSRARVVCLHPEFGPLGRRLSGLIEAARDRRVRALS